MNLNAYMKPLAVLAGLYAIYKFGPNNTIKAAAVSVGAVVLAKQLPVVKDVV